MPQQTRCIFSVCIQILLSAAVGVDVTTLTSDRSLELDEVDGDRQSVYELVNCDLFTVLFVQLCG